MMRTALLVGLVLAITGCAPVQTDITPTLSTQSIRPAAVRVDFTRDSLGVSSASGDAGVAGRAVTIDNPVRVASISKLVVALAAMRLVDAGKIDLDLDVSRYLGWQARNPAFPDTPITMRQLLSHRAGLTDGIDYLVPLDGDLSVVLTNPKVWDAAHAPGSYFQYANINSPLIAATMEAVTGERFDRLMARLVLTPLKLDACYNWGAGCSDGRRAAAVTLLRSNGNLARDAAITGRDPCPVLAASDGGCDIDKSYRLGRNGSAFGPQGALRISPRDLARVGQVLLNDGRPLLSPKAFAEMIGPVWQFDGSNGADDKGYFKAYGLGVHWLDDGQGGQWIGHVGEAYSLRAGFWVNRKTGKGFVRYATMVDEFAPVGHCFDTCP